MAEVRIGPAAILSAAALMMGNQECLRSDSDIIRNMAGERANRYRSMRIREIVSLARDMAKEVELQVSEDSRNHP